LSNADILDGKTAIVIWRPPFETNGRKAPDPI
jgi:hypothetical protein